MLICPVCLPEENRLHCTVDEAHGEDIDKGSLTCRHCGRVYPIQEGIARLDPGSSTKGQTAGSKYETVPVLSSYMWSHYGDILGEPDASGAYGEWADLMHHRSGLAIDAGAAVGRFTFEMSRKCDFVVGVDTSLSFIRAARAFMMNGRIQIALPEEGTLVREETVELPEAWDSDRVEFIVGDALALPFRSEAFSSLASLNLIDKVPFPITHFREMNRIAKKTDTQFLFSDPFSWSKEVAAEEDWLGGTRSGPYAGRGLENVMALLTGKKDALSTKWRIETHGHIWWKIRAHANYFELIRSCFVKAVR